MPKPRHRVPKKIKALVAAGKSDEAVMVAEFGRELSDLEDELHLHFFETNPQQAIAAYTFTCQKAFQYGSPQLVGEIVKQREAFKRSYKGRVARRRARFAKMLIAWLEAKDSDKFRELANAIDFVKARKPADPLRWQLLTLKRALEMEGNSWPVAKVARFIKWRGHDKEEGFPQLRKLCKDLKFPLQTREIRVKQ